MPGFKKFEDTSDMELGSTRSSHAARYDSLSTSVPSCFVPLEVSKSAVSVHSLVRSENPDFA